MRAPAERNPLLWLSLTAGALVTAIATWSFFAVIWFLTHPD
ncbi:MAG: hypothetical protein ABI520_00365 [Caldimonas sp.]